MEIVLFVSNRQRSGYWVNLARGNAFDQLPGDGLTEHGHIFSGEVVRNIGIKKYIPTGSKFVIASPQSKGYGHTVESIDCYRYIPMICFITTEFSCDIY